MVKKALCLSGGATRGSFQMGAIKCLYENYGFRPDIITGTSIGAINGIKLACAPPPAVNDSVAILTAVKAGTIDPQLMHMQELEQFWLAVKGRRDFFWVRRPFIGTWVDDALAENQPSGGLIDVTTVELGLVGAYLPLMHIISAIAATVELSKIQSLVQNIMVEDAVAELTPVEILLRHPGPAGLPTVNAGMVGDPPPYINNLYYGTPLYMAVVSLETGKLRYVTNRGEFYERDGATPVATALTDPDIAAALDDNLQPLSQVRRDHIKTTVSNYQTALKQFAANSREFRDPNTPVVRKWELTADSHRQQERAIHWAKAAQEQIGHVRIKATVRDKSDKPDPIQGALASASLPVLLDPPEIGGEQYCDAGLREIIPIDIILDKDVTEIVGILCSKPELLGGDSMKDVGLIDIGLRAATQISIAEVTQGDLVGAARSGISTRIIAPTVDVHDGLDLKPSQLEIAMHYGWMRAADATHPVTVASERDEFEQTSELITRLRMRCFDLEHSLYSLPVPSTSDFKWDYFELRMNRWAIMHVAARRTARGLPLHPAQATWSTAWERDFRPGGPRDEAPSVWSDLQVRIKGREGFDYTVNPWPVSSPTQFSPDLGSLEDAGSDRIYWLVRGAIFEDTTRTLHPDQNANVVVPNGLHQFLPTIPDGAHLMAETQDPNTLFLVIGGKKYTSPTPEWIAAAGLTGASHAIVPTGGMMQIPDGGVPSLLGNLTVVDDALHQPLSHVRLESLQGSSTTVDILLYNKSSAATITNIDIGLIGVGAAQGIAVSRTPASIDPNAIDFFTLSLNPGAAGVFDGSLTISSSDTVVPRITVELTLVVQPLGDMPQLQLTPAPLEFTGAVNSIGYSTVTITNVGQRAPEKVIARVESSDDPPLFSVAGTYRGWPYELEQPDLLRPGSAVDMAMDFYPTVEGTFTAELVVSASGTTSLNHPYKTTARIPLSGKGSAPKLRLLTRTPQPADFNVAEIDVLRPGHDILPVAEIDVLRPGRDIPRTTVNINLGTVQPPVTNATSVYILNLGALTLEIPKMLGYYASPVVTQSFPIEIPAGGWAEVKLDFGVYFAPVVGQFSETLRILSNDPVTAEGQVVITGSVSGARGAIRPEYIDFGHVGVNTTVDSQTAFKNQGTVDLHITSAVWRDKGGEFKLATAPPGTVPAGEEVALDVKFGPVIKAGAFSDFLTIETTEGVTAILGTRAIAS